MLFSPNESDLSGHKIKDGTIRMDESKVKAFFDSEVPTTIKELRSFLGLTNFIRDS